MLPKSVQSPLVLSSDHSYNHRQVEPLFYKMQSVQERLLPTITETSEHVPEGSSPFKVLTSHSPSASHSSQEALPWSVFTELVMYAPSPNTGIEITPLSPPHNGVSLEPQTNLHTLPMSQEPEEFQPFDKVFFKIKDQKTFDEAADISITYVGETTAGIDDDFTSKLSFNYDCRCHVQGQLTTGAPIDILIDTGATKSYLSRRYFEQQPYLHDLLRYKAHLGDIRLRDGTLCKVDFIIPIVVTIEGHVLEVYTLITTMGNTELVLGLKELMELKASVVTQKFKVEFLNHSPTLYPAKVYTIPFARSMEIELKCQYPKPLSGIGVGKFLFYPNKVFDTAKVLVKQNKVFLNVVNRMKEAIKCYPHSPIEILDIHSMGYF